MLASELFFLRSEGAILGWNMNGTAEELYNQGIRLSFERCGLTAKEAETYLLNKSDKPANYPGVRGAGKIATRSSVTIKWNELASQEEKLERIITQKWLAIYPLGQEAWSEFRRTGYPKIYPIVDNLSNGTISSEEQVRRLPFPESEHLGNKDEVIKAINLLGGPDTGGTKLWWDAK